MMSTTDRERGKRRRERERKDDDDEGWSLRERGEKTKRGMGVTTMRLRTKMIESIKGDR